MERLAYLLKNRFPGLFRPVAKIARGVTVLRFARRREQALANARIGGSVGGRPAEIRPLETEDVALLTEFLAAMPEEHLRFFHPHGFGAREVERVLRSRAFMTYGLFVSGELVGYALLKLSPMGSAFLGRLVDPSHAGRGVGRFLARYLYWQAALARLRAHSTISRQNAASLRSHEAVYRIVAELPNDYLLIEFPPGDSSPPRLKC
jgi:GNAT superfamily N-acetyltransferase